MAGEASSSSWWKIPTTSVSSCDSINHRQYDSPYEVDPASCFTNLHGLSMSSSSANISGEPAESQLWNQALLNVGGGRDMPNHHRDDGKSFLQPWNFKSLTTDQILGLASDYLDNPLSLSSLEKLSRIQFERLSIDRSDMAIDWSLAPPNPHLDCPLSPSVSTQLPVTRLPVKLDRLHSSYSLCNYDGCLNNPPLEGSNSFINRGNGRRFTATSEGKRKRSDDSSEALLKKSKNENSMASCAKAPKLTEKITALQQLVSPFGKTDTASVLFETYNCIKILHEQVQLLSDPFMKSAGSKNHGDWGEMERKGSAETNLDLRSKGLCLIPVSYFPEDHKENGGLDYWMPTYRTCLYR
ncbi:transcription factor bHLH111-like [Zingiber officinale]|uniref:transcription factor bHLH111-like n=1 Tax=Zingiber officinale TaxID=94328 RepID=UPI001C4D8201|nr:transcription factor bHLH111-like [Zingiber officinale]